MKPINPFLPAVFTCIAILTQTLDAAPADPMRTQTVQLRKGWNSVFLEVEPQDPSPNVLFANTPAETVATFFPKTRPAEYIRDPGDAPWREEGWGVWYAQSRPDAFLSSLHTILSHQSYLIYASSDFLWSVKGTVSLVPIQWQPNAYNLTGFALDPVAPPTFQQFFAGSSAHRGQRVYRLVSGEWKPVQDPAGTRMRAGEAYWVYCEGNSDFQGPIKLEPPVGGQMNFGSSVVELQLRMRNASPTPARISVETVSVGPPLPLSYLAKDLRILRITYPSLPARLDLPIMAPSQSETLQLLVRREAMTAASQSVLLRIADGQGVELWIAAIANQLN